MKLRYIGPTSILVGKSPDNKNLMWPLHIEQVVLIKEIIQSSRDGYVVMTDMDGNKFPSVHFASFIIES